MRIRTLTQLKNAALGKRAVSTPHHARMPAAFAINLQGHILERWLSEGMWLYKPKKK